MHEIDRQSGCWIWKGPTCAGGRYGRIAGTHPMLMAHRHYFSLYKGEIPKGMVVCHSCDNGLCVNPEHLFLGTMSDNMKDAVDKKRLPLMADQKGEKNAKAKYDMRFAESVREYYEKFKPSYSELAKQFGLKSKGHAHAIVKRLIWT